MTKQTNKQFSFTNENLFDYIIFRIITPRFIDALQSNNLIDLHKAVESYYYTTQQFYQNHSEKIEERLFKIDDDIHKTQNVVKKSDVINNRRLISSIKIELRQIWRLISNELHKNGFYKKQYTIENNKLALATR